MTHALTHHTSPTKPGDNAEWGWWSLEDGREPKLRFPTEPDARAFIAFAEACGCDLETDRPLFLQLVLEHYIAGKNEARRIDGTDVRVFDAKAVFGYEGNEPCDDCGGTSAHHRRGSSCDPGSDYEGGED